MSELEKIQNEYIEFLGGMLDSVEMFLANHHHKWSIENMEKGKDLRKKITDIKDEL